VRGHVEATLAHRLDGLGSSRATPAHRAGGVDTRGDTPSREMAAHQGLTHRRAADVAGADHKDVKGLESDDGAGVYWRWHFEPARNRARGDKLRASGAVMRGQT
jgi:hypothetical protein